MLLKNLPSRRYTRRMIALGNLERRNGDKQEIATLRERTNAPPIDHETKKLMVYATEARKRHHAGKLTR